MLPQGRGERGIEHRRDNRMTVYDYGDIICSGIDAQDGKLRARVQVNGLKLLPPSATPHVYLSEASFSSVTDALHHGIDYINERFPAGGPPFRTSDDA
jgi:hypothetical protein